MRRCVLPLILIVFFLLLLYPEIALSGALSGLLLWYHHILPVLFPFMVISNYLILSGLISKISKLSAPIIGRLFRVSDMGSFAILIGFLCGYPMGAKMAAQLVKNHSITPQEGAYILSFANQISPGFVMGFLLTDQLHIVHARFLYLAVFWMAPVCCSFLFRLLHPQTGTKEAELTFPPSAAKKNAGLFSCLEDAIQDAINSIVMVGAYMMLFAIAISFLKECPELTVFPWKNYMIPLMELSSGIEYLTALQARKPDIICIVSCFMLTSFGGICTLFQTYTFTINSKINTRLYIVEKPITAGVTGLFIFLLSCLLH